MDMTSKNRLGQENIGRLLFSLSLPAIIGQLVNLLYNIVDRIYIGHIEGIGGQALTGVGLAMPIVIIITAFAALVGMGGAPRMAIMMGREDLDSARKILGNASSLLVIISILLTAFFLALNEKLLLLFGASPETLGYALDYMGIYTLGTIFVQLAIGLNPFISSQGFSKTSMFTVLIGALLNIVLDPIFIFVLDMGVRGAALATVISQAFSAFWVLAFLRSDRGLVRLDRKYMGLDGQVLLPIIGLGLSPFIMQVTESLTSIAFNINLQKYSGDAAIAAMTILTSAMQFLFLPLSGLTQGAQPILSYNFGAGRLDRVRDTFKLLLKSALIYTAIFWGFLMVWPGVFASIFTSDREIIDLASWGMRIFMASGIFMAVQISCQQTFVALGNAKTSLFLAILRKIILLIPLIFILPLLTKNKVLGVLLAEPLADFLAASTSSYLFYREFKSFFKKKEGQA